MFASVIMKQRAMVFFVLAGLAAAVSLTTEINKSPSPEDFHSENEFRELSTFSYSYAYNDTMLPSPVPTMLPTISEVTITTEFGGVAAAVAAVVGASVAAAVGSSVSGSVGSSTAGSGSGSVNADPSVSTTNSASSGEALSLLFLVQTIATTAKLSIMPDEYTKGFAGSFAFFNLQISAPWSKAATDDEDEQIETPVDIFEGNIFWATVSLCSLVTLHFIALKVASRYITVPPIMELPHLEIKVLLALVMGLLDSSLGVLVYSSASVGWKMLATFVIMSNLVFASWIISESMDFKYSQAIWINEGDNVHKVKSRHPPYELVPIEFLSSSLDRAQALLFASMKDMPVGGWVRRDINTPWKPQVFGFERLTPAHVRHAGFQIFEQFGHLLCLNTLANFPTAQTSMLLSLTVFHAYTIWGSKSFVHLAVADSRSTMSDAISTCAGYVFALISACLPDTESSSGMTTIQLLTIAQCVALDVKLHDTALTTMTIAKDFVLNQFKKNDGEKSFEMKETEKDVSGKAVNHEKTKLSSTKHVHSGKGMAI